MLAGPGLVAFFAVFHFCSATAFSHECKLEGYDKTFPRAIKSLVQDQWTKFTWMSDVELDGEFSWSCSCILNNDSKGWVGRWDKAGISVPFSRPLTPGGYQCKEEFLGRHNQEPDRDAPIIYGSTNTIQKAAVFVAAETKNQLAEAGFVAVDVSSVQLSSDGKDEVVKVSATLVNKMSEGYQLNLSAPDGYTIGFVNGATGWDNGLARSVLNGGKGAQKIDDIYGWGELDSERGGGFLPSGDYIMFPAYTDAKLTSESVAGMKLKQVEFVLFDVDRKPVLKSSIDLPVAE